jgi:hypothetical protein
VQHRSEADASAEVLWVGGDRNQRLGRGFQQDAGAGIVNTTW